LITAHINKSPVEALISSV